MHPLFETVNTCIFDFDGVLADTNGIKEKNIRFAAKPHARDSEHLETFIERFTSGYGIPREIKIAEFFDEETGHMIQEDYTSRNLSDVQQLDLTPHARDFIRAVGERGIERMIVSGADPAEIHPILRHNSVADQFSAVRGGPKTKKENIAELKPAEPAVFIGDSRTDHETARYFGFSFIFLTEYSHFEGWKSYFSEYPDVIIARGLGELLDSQFQGSD